MLFAILIQSLYVFMCYKSGFWIIL